MKTGVFTFLFVFAVSSSQTEGKCVQDYVDCAVLLVNKWQYSVNCSLPIPDLECFTNVFKECDPSQNSKAAFLESFANLLKDICHSLDAKKVERQNAVKCVGKNSDSFRACSRNLPEDVCSASNSIVQCTSSAMYEKCGELGKEATEKLMFPIKLLDRECLHKAATGYEEVMSCMIQNAQSFLSCKLGKLDDMCSSFNGFTQCLVDTTDGVCGSQASTLIRTFIETGTSLTGLCKGEPLSECQNEALKCTADMFEINEIKCTDGSKYLGCLSDATKKCEQEKPSLYVIVLEKYNDKFPEYCNPESSFSKNIQKHFTCISEHINNVVRPCYEKSQKDLAELKENDIIGPYRIAVNYLLCVHSGIEGKCTKEAGDAVNDLLQPLVDSLDEACRLQTGKRCNSACGLKVATWVLIASLAYLLTRRHT